MTSRAIVVLRSLTSIEAQSHCCLEIAMIELQLCLKSITYYLLLRIPVEEDNITERSRTYCSNDYNLLLQIEMVFT